MKFLVDAQLPRRLATFLKAAGHDAIHTTDLVTGNRTADGDIAKHADSEDRVVISKDRDFRISHVLNGSPRALLIVATGNITNVALIQLFTDHLDAIVCLLVENPVVEVLSDRLIAHADRPSTD